MDVVVVLAVGNPLRGDDGAAREAARALAGEEGLRVVEAHQLLPEHAEEVAGARRVVFLDARSDGAPGEVRWERVEPGEAPALGHLGSPGAILALAGALRGARPEAFLVTIAGADFTHREGCSDRVRRGLPEMRACALALARGAEPPGGRAIRAPWTRPPR